MAYIKTGSAHTTHLINNINGDVEQKYSRYETGYIQGEFRDMLALIADETGFDGLGFDASAGSNDDKWHVVNLFENGGHYVDSVAIAGALDEDHAKLLATTQFDHLGADYGVIVGYFDGMQFDHMTEDQAWSVDAITKLLNNPSQDKHYLPVITPKELYEESVRASFDDVQWDNLNLISHDGNLSSLYTDVRRADTFRELTQEFDLQQALIDLEAEEAEFDSIMDTVNRLPMLKDRLFRAMSQASNETLSVTNVTQTKPFKRGGVVNVAFVFDLSDGQKLSIWFHNPDSTPSKLLAGDMMVSWKWLLNKRDVTAVLSPINGKEVKIPTLARQMMLLASKNSKNFKRAQERKAKRDAEINKAKNDIEQKKQTIEQLDNDIASLKEQIDAALQVNKGKADKDTTADSGVSGGLDENNQEDLEQQDNNPEQQLPEPDIKIASNGMRYEYQGNTEAGEAIKIYMYSKNDSHWLVYGKKDGQFTVYANNPQSRAYSGGGGGGYGMPKVFKDSAELFGKYPKFEAVFNESGFDILEAGNSIDSTINSFIDHATKNGWQLDIATLNNDEKYLYKTISNTDVMLEITKEGYNAMTPDGDVLSYGEAESLNDFNATNKQIEANIAAHEEETGSTNEPGDTTDEKQGDKSDWFAERASGMGWQLDILSMNSQVKKLFKVIDGVDLTLEVSDQGFRVTKKDGTEVYSGTSDDLSDVDAANILIEKAVKDMKENTEVQQANTAPQANAAYSQEDIDFLNAIIAGDFDPDNIDMDKMIEIGEKDENDPLYEQAINIVLEALDEASSNL